MKNINYVINGVLAIAVLILFILHFTGKNNTIPSTGTFMSTSEEYASIIPVAYINIDSLLDNYIFSIDLNEALTRKSENVRANLIQQARNFQSEVESFQLKVRTGAFATQQRLDLEQRRLEQKQTDLQALEEKQSLELNEEMQHMNVQLRDTVMTHLKAYNETKGYQIIFSNTSSTLVSPILLADEVYNITAEFTDYLNKKWTSPNGN